MGRGWSPHRWSPAPVRPYSQNQIVVDGVRGFFDTQTAIDAAESAVILGPGKYPGVTITNPSVSVYGSGYATEIDGGDGFGIEILDDNVDVQNLSATSDGSDIVRISEGAENTTLSNLHLSDSTGGGVEVRSGIDTRIDNLSLSGVTSGIFIRAPARQTMVSNCVVREPNGGGIYDRGQVSKIQQCQVTEAHATGILSSGNDSNIGHNTVLRSWDNGIEVSGSNQVLTDNRVSESGGTNIHDTNASGLTRGENNAFDLLILNIDDFEDLEIPEWSGDTAYYEPTSTAAYGDHAIRKTSNADKTIYSTTGLDNYPGYPSKSRAYIYPENLESIAAPLFAFADVNNYLQATLRVDQGAGTFELEEISGGADTSLDAVTLSYSAGRWYELQIIRDDGSYGRIANTHELILSEYNPSNDTRTQVATVSAEPSTTFQQNSGIGLKTTGLQHATYDWLHLRQ